MTDLNNVNMIGRLTKDAERKTTQGGTAVLRFTIANGYREKNGDNWTDQTNFFDVVVIGRSADALSQYMTKGRQVVISGVLRQQRWEQNQEKKSRVEIMAETVQLLAAPSNNREVEPPKAEGPKGPESFDDSDDLPF